MKFMDRLPEDFEIAVERLDPQGIKKTNTYYFESPQSFEVFGKQCASKVYISSGCSDGGLSHFDINIKAVEELNAAMPKISKIIESSISELTRRCEDFYNSTNETPKKLTDADTKKAFDYVSAIGAENGYKEAPYVVVILEGKYPYWDEEHGISLKIRGGRVVEVGVGDQFI